MLRDEFVDDADASGGDLFLRREDRHRFGLDLETLVRGDHAGLLAQLREMMVADRRQVVVLMMMMRVVVDHDTATSIFDNLKRSC